MKPGSISVSGPLLRTVYARRELRSHLAGRTEVRDAPAAHADDSVRFVAHRGGVADALRIVAERERGAAQGDGGGRHRVILSRELCQRRAQLLDARRLAQHLVDVGRNVLLVEQALAPAGEQDRPASSAMPA
jgi:hypothetical protein